MKKCASCGRENIDEAIYCANCGARLDSISTDSSSSNGKSTPTPALSTLKNHIANDPSSSAGSNSASNSNRNQGTASGIDKAKICCCYVPIVLLIAFVIFAFILSEFPENFSNNHEGDFKYLDTDGDGKLSFQEARQLDPYMTNKEIRPYFLEADTNNNGYLIGHEFDGFYNDVSYEPDSSSSSSSSSSGSNSGSSSHSYSSSSSSSSHSYNDYDDYDSSSEGYVLTCPYCGSEAIYESGSYYKCAECGSTIYSPDDLELAYQEGYMDLLVPVMIY